MKKRPIQHRHQPRSSTQTTSQDDPRMQSGHIGAPNLQKKTVTYSRELASRLLRRSSSKVWPDAFSQAMRSLSSALRFSSNSSFWASSERSVCSWRRWSCRQQKRERETSAETSAETSEPSSVEQLHPLPNLWVSASSPWLSFQRLAPFLAPSSSSSFRAPAALPPSALEDSYKHEFNKNKTNHQLTRSSRPLQSRQENEANQNKPRKRSCVDEPDESKSTYHTNTNGFIIQGEHALKRNGIVIIVCGGRACSLQVNGNKSTYKHKVATSVCVSVCVCARIKVKPAVTGQKDRAQSSLVRNAAGFAVGGGHADSGQFPAAEVFVVDVVGHLLEVCHVGADQHVAQGDEVAVFHILH